MSLPTTPPKSIVEKNNKPARAPRPRAPKSKPAADDKSAPVAITAAMVPHLDKLHIEYVPLAQVLRWERNPKKHDLEAIRTSFLQHGFKDPPKFEPALNGGAGGIAEGNGRMETLATMRANGDEPPRGVAVLESKDWAVPILFGVDAQSEAAAESYAIDHNNLTLMGADFTALDIASLWTDEYKALLQDLEQHGAMPVSVSLDDLGQLMDLDLEEGGKGKSMSGDEARQSLAERFGVPPFSVLDARQGYWQDRKRAWIALGINSEVGRDTNLAFSRTSQTPAVYELKNELRAAAGKEPSWDDVLAEAKKRGLYLSEGTSIFDPVLCELAYRWFCPPGGTVLDPFCGGSVRGVVASKLGRKYSGIDLRAEQVEANKANWAEFARENKGALDEAPDWRVGDSRNLDTILDADCKADFVFSCPPYADLEQYSDDPDDLSNMEYTAFVEAYREIIAKSVARLRNDRFACFVVGDVRDKQGNYRNFVSDTISAFIDEGAQLYNEAILVTVAGSLPVRAGAQFQNSRKLGKTHQNVLVFVKGDAKVASQIGGKTEFGELTDEVNESGLDTGGVSV